MREIRKDALVRFVKVTSIVSTRHLRVDALDYLFCDESASGIENILGDGVGYLARSGGVVRWARISISLAYHSAQDGSVFGARILRDFFHDLKLAPGEAEGVMGFYQLSMGGVVAELLEDLGEIKGVGVV